MKRKALFILILLYSASIYAQVAIDRDSLVVDLARDKFTQESDSDGLFRAVLEINELYSGDRTPDRSNLLLPPLEPLDPFDPFLPFPKPLSKLPSSVQIDKTKTVGEIPFQSMVSSGALTYNVPIEIYQGKNGHQPTIALSYNSMMGNGVAGHGWGIGGLSVITISNSTYYHDGGNVKPAGLDKNSAFSLDGTRLIKLSETSSQINYQTEHGNIKVAFYAPLGKYYFDVWYPDGKKATFGFTTNTSSQVTYPITKNVDALGSYIDYTYLSSDNTFYISEIKYGSNTTQYGAVKFAYQGRYDLRSSYVAGRLINESKLLSKIETYYQSSVLLNTYSMSYENSVYSFLSQISLKSNGKEVNPLMFYYGNDHDEGRFQTGTVYLETYFANSNAPDLILHKGKFNSLALSDGLVAYPNFQAYGVTAQDNKGNYLYGSKYSPTQNLLVYKDLSDILSVPVKIQAGEGFQKLFPADINGDGDDELVRINYWLNDQNNARVEFTTYDKNMTARNAYFLLEGTFAEGSRLSAVPRLFITGDFNGDGKTELVAVSGNKMPKGETRTWSRTTMFNLEARSKIYDQTPFLFDYFKDALFAVDYNGDGKTDICLINSVGTYIYSFEGGTFVQIAFTNGITNSNLSGSSKRELLVEDINGDGLTDLLLSPKKNDYWVETKKRACGVCRGCKGELVQDDPIIDPFPNHPDKPNIDKPIEITSMCTNPIYYTETHYNSTYKTWTVFLATGTGFASSTFQFLSNSDNDYQFLLHDMNGDKLPDLAVKSGTQISVYMNQNGKLNTAVETAKITVDSNAHFITGIIGNGYSYRASQLLSIKDATVTPITFTRNDAQERMLTGMVNSYGVIEKIDYANMTNSSVYRVTSGYSTSFPHNKLYADINVVSNTYSLYDNKYITSKSYQYNDAVMHRQGLGFRGFRKIIVRDNNTGTQTEQTFDPLKFGVVTQVVSPTIEATYSYTSSVAANKIAKITLNRKTEKDKLKNVTVTSTYTYDTYSNVTKETVLYGSDLTVTTDNAYNNIDNTTTYKLGILREQVITKSKGGLTWIERMYIPVFNSDRLPVVKAQSANGKSVCQTNYTYKDGLVTQESKKEYSASTNLITNYEYDSYGRIIKKTNPLGLKETYTYNAKGQLISMKNHKEQETRFGYDDFGRKISTTRPDGAVEASSLSWTQTPSSALWVNTVTTTGGPASQTYYDALGREVRTGKQRFDGNYVYVDSQYDEKGRLAKVSQPFKGATPAQWNTYIYDSYDRITSLLYASGKQDTYSYSNASVTSIIDGVSKTETYNAAGNIISVTDAAGTITFHYRPDGQVGSVDAPGQITTELSYDELGRKISIYDPSFGQIRYTYDAMGNMSEEAYADGNVMKQTYDNFHRVTKKEVAGQTINYVYNADNLIASEVSSNGTSKTYVYDALMRLSTLTETNVDGKWLKKTFTYAGGNTSSLAYASNAGNIVTENYTYTYGNLSEIKLNNATSIWKLTGENALGLTTGVTTGCLTRTYSYDAFGNPTGRVVKNGAAIIQNAGYNFNVMTGNLNWRKDNVRNIQENFGYDNLNRLTSFAGKTATYSNTGNITNISNVGAFSYSAEKPYAIAFITPYGTEVPMREQQITYNGLRRPTTISENGYVASFTYNGEGSRVKMDLKYNNQVQLNKYYWENQYEMETGIAGTKEILYLGGDAYSAVAAYVKEGTGSWAVYYICGDYLGNITHIVNSSGVVKQELSYDAWGRLRNPVNQSLYAVGTEPALYLGRGYTGHEHLTAFGLINMNARLYDPVIGRFLSPDPQLQNPYSSQNYNRYSYCLNNPLRYVDQDGEFIFGWVTGFFKGLFKGKNPWTSAWNSAINEIKISFGLFQGDFGQIASRFTWELPQTLFGYTWSHVSNWGWQVDKVSYWGGATVMSGDNWGKKAVTLGSFIVGDHSISADPNNSLFQHEYGHYLQSQSMGWAYLSRIGIPSLMSADGSGNHSFQVHEQDANARAFMYFNKKVPGFYQTSKQYKDNLKDGLRKGWDFDTNPLDVYHKNAKGIYYDYHNAKDRELINGLKITAKWYDYSSWSVPIVGTIGVGIYNGKR